MLNRLSNHIDCLGMVKKKKKANMVDVITVLNRSDLFHRNISRGSSMITELSGLKSTRKKCCNKVLQIRNIHLSKDEFFETK